MHEALVPRSLFPAVERAVYLDTANDGIVAATVRARTETFWRESAAGEPGYGDLRAAAYEGARDAVARLLSVERSRVAVTNSASEAMGTVVWGLDARRGANVVLVEGDFPTVTYAWLQRARHDGIEIRPVPAGGRAEDTIERAVDDRTVAVSVSHVNYATGERLDLARLAAVAHAKGALLAVDVAQSAGVVPIDLRAEAVDIVVGHAAKWLLGETGAGFCVVSDAVLDRLEPRAPGWRSAVDPWAIDGDRITLAPDARRIEVSSISYVSRFELAAAIDLLLDVGIARALAHALALGADLADRLRTLGATVATPAEDDRRAGIVACRLRGCASADLVAALRARGVSVSARGGLLRWSTHVYNDGDDVAAALERLEDVSRST